MAFLCKIGLHKWQGCKCTVCAKNRDEGHAWSGCKCSVCNKTRGEEHDWSKDCEKCAKCGKTRDEEHDWSKDCEKCAKCGKTRSKAHTLSGCKCSKCGSYKHEWRGFSCSLCGQRNYPGMLEKIYSSGRRNSIIGFLQHSKDQYVAELNQCRDEDEMRHLVLKQHKFLTGVILEMFNPIVSDSDVKTLNQIDAAFIDKGDKT